MHGQALISQPRFETMEEMLSLSGSVACIYSMKLNKPVGSHDMEIESKFILQYKPINEKNTLQTNEFVSNITKEDAIIIRKWDPTAYATASL